MGQLSGPEPARTGLELRNRERRTAVRYPCAAGTVSSALHADTDVCLAARVLDLSRGGIGLEVSQPVEVGTILGVELHSHTLRLPCFLLARVIHLQPGAGGRWVIGCRLASQLPEQELQALL